MLIIEEAKSGGPAAPSQLSRRQIALPSSEDERCDVKSHVLARNALTGDIDSRAFFCMHAVAAGPVGSTEPLRKWADAESGRANSS